MHPRVSAFPQCLCVVYTRDCSPSYHTTEMHCSKVIHRVMQPHNSPSHVILAIHATTPPSFQVLLPSAYRPGAHNQNKTAGGALGLWCVFKCQMAIGLGSVSSRNRQLLFWPLTHKRRSAMFETVLIASCMLHRCMHRCIIVACIVHATSLHATTLNSKGGGCLFEPLSTPLVMTH